MGKLRAKTDRAGQIAPTFVVAIAVLLVALLLGIGATASYAHDDLLTTTPADGAQLQQAPEVVIIKFAGAPLKDSTKLVATGAAGQFPLNPVVVNATATASWPADAAPGTYKIAWRNVGSDGHPLTGTFSFGYAALRPTPTPSAEIRAATPVATTGAGQSAETTGTGGSVWLLPTVIGVLVVVAGIVGIQGARRRKRNDLPNT